MLTTATAGSLVGAAGNPVSVPTKHIRVLRAFYHERLSRAVGEVLEVPGPVAAELVSANKAVVIEKPAPVAAPAEPPPAETVPTERPRRRVKE